MCDCKKTLEDKLNENFIKRNPNANNHKTKLMGYVLVFGSNTLLEKGEMGIEHSADYQGKNGYKNKKAKSSMLFTFCPFCGKKYDSAD